MHDPYCRWCSNILLSVLGLVKRFYTLDFIPGHFTSHQFDEKENSDHHLHPDGWQTRGRESAFSKSFVCWNSGIGRFPAGRVGCLAPMLTTSRFPNHWPNYGNKFFEFISRGSDRVGHEFCAPGSCGAIHESWGAIGFCPKWYERNCITTFKDGR